MDTSRNWIIGWLIAFLDFPISGALATLLIGRLETPLEGFIGGLVIGTIIGLAQMFALRRRLPIGFGWIIVTAVGLAAGVSLSVALFGAETSLNATLIRGPMTGLLLGIAQWVVLRQHVRLALGWLPALTLVYGIAWFITVQVIGESINEGFVVFGASGALVFQVLTGVTLWLLLRWSPSGAPRLRSI